MANPGREFRVIYDPAFSKTLLVVEIDAVETASPISLGNLADVAAGLLVSLSIVLLALRVTGTIPEMIQAISAYAVFVFFFAYPLYRLIWSIVTWLRHADESAAPATWS